MEIVFTLVQLHSVLCIEIHCLARLCWWIFDSNFFSTYAATYDLLCIHFVHGQMCLWTNSCKKVAGSRANTFVIWIGIPKLPPIGVMAYCTPPSLLLIWECLLPSNLTKECVAKLLWIFSKLIRKKCHFRDFSICIFMFQGHTSFSLHSVCLYPLFFFLMER